ncbi:Hypothetical protein, putative [Bodo saltans]|uniref:Uncharacterized protein n=1 Tax=Bodo saltans TaxID=75058 RepID=A0A0S4JEG1_BODSA|nr:Hypothetical protein, putative [Bodo saltans]|eukprot:CUG89974.1 Hypothetical protein, putative [Bodo saltans]
MLRLSLRRLQFVRAGSNHEHRPQQPHHHNHHNQQRHGNNHTGNNGNNSGAPHGASQQKLPSETSTHISTAANMSHHQHPKAIASASPPIVSSPPPSSSSLVEQQLAAAQLRITQLLCTPDVAAWEHVTSALQSTERDLQQLMSDFRYTQLSLSATHRALQEELRESLTICALKETTELRRAAGKAEAKEMLRKHIGFRARRVSEIAPPSHAASRSLGARTTTTGPPS